MSGLMGWLLDSAWASRILQSHRRITAPTVNPRFFTELDAQLGGSCGLNGEASASDFLLVELPSLSEVTVQLNVISCSTPTVPHACSR